MTRGQVTIAANLVPYLRRGVKRELSATLGLLAFQLDTALDRAEYYDALARFDEARALLDAIGVSDDRVQHELELELGRWPRLLLRVLESEYDIEVMRLQDRVAEGFDLPLGEIPALGGLISDVRKQVEVTPRRGGGESTRQLSRRSRRSRGNG